MVKFNINDTVIISVDSDKYEGILLDMHNGKAMVYCPAFNEEEPYIVLSINDIELVDYQARTGIIN